VELLQKDHKRDQRALVMSLEAEAARQASALKERIEEKKLRANAGSSRRGNRPSMRPVSATMLSSSAVAAAGGSASAGENGGAPLFSPEGGAVGSAARGQQQGEGRGVEIEDPIEGFGFAAASSSPSSGPGTGGRTTTGNMSSEWARREWESAQADRAAQAVALEEERRRQQKVTHEKRATSRQGSAASRQRALNRSSSFSRGGGGGSLSPSGGGGGGGGSAAGSGVDGAESFSAGTRE
jgi:hypothetical protein